MQTATIEAQVRCAGAYRDYLEAIAQLSPGDDATRWIEAYNEYTSTVLDTMSGKDAERAAESAYTDYLEAVKAAWSKLRLELLEPNDLAAIAGSLMSVASTTAAASSQSSS